MFNEPDVHSRVAVYESFVELSFEAVDHVMHSSLMFQLNVFIEIPN